MRENIKSACSGASTSAIDVAFAVLLLWRAGHGFGWIRSNDLLFVRKGVVSVWLAGCGSANGTKDRVREVRRQETRSGQGRSRERCGCGVGIAREKGEGGTFGERARTVAKSIRAKAGGGTTRKNEAER